MDSLSIVLLTVPIFFPVIEGLKFNPIWFGVLVTRVSEMGLITPPVGMNVFVIKGVAKDVPMYTIFRASCLPLRRFRASGRSDRVAQCP